MTSGNLAAPLGRLLLSAIFLMSGVHKLTSWSQTEQQMTNEGMVAVTWLLIGAVILELGGGLSVLLGLWARWGALALVVMVVPTTVIFHDFWQYQGQQQQMQMINFMKNLAILGGLLLVISFGPGPLSIDHRRHHSTSPTTR